MKRLLSVMFQTFFSLSVFLYCRVKSLFKLYDSVVLFETESVHLFHDRRSILTVTHVPKEITKHKIVTLRIERHINAGTIARLTGC